VGGASFNPPHDEQQSKSNQLIMNSEYSSRSGQGKQKKRPEISFSSGPSQTIGALLSAASGRLFGADLAAIQP
jgi:hypothetical protein